MLVGRSQELEEIAAALDRAALVTLTGPGGVGKTTLAKAVAAEWPPDMALFSDLTSFGADDVAEGMAGALSFASFSDLMDDIGDRPMLLVLDNCEHLLDAAADVAEQLLAAGSQIKILATSRERLDVAGEVSIRIDPLPTEGSPSPAAEMFLDAAASRGLTPTDDQATVDELCRRLDGLPLALELAAARASAMTAAEILTNLDSRLDLLSRRRSRGPERHASLSATIGWSYQQLEPAERTLFTQLSVLRSPFTVGMAGAVGNLDDAGTRDVLDTLVERSLLIHQPTGGTSTYRMLETIKAFAAEQLEDPSAAEDRLFDYLTARADEMAAVGIMYELIPPIELDQSFRNTYWAVDRAINDEDLDRCLRLVAPWWWLEDVGHQSEASELLERIVARWPDLTPELAVAWGLLACLTWETDRDKATATVAASSTGLGAAYGERILGLTTRNAGSWHESLVHFEKASAIASDLGHKGLSLEVRMHAALAHARAGDIDRAVAGLEAVIAEAGDYPLVNAWATDFLAFTLLPHDPMRSGELARTLIPHTGTNNWLRASTAYNLGVVALTEKDIDEAATLLADALDAFTAIRSTTDILLVYMAASALLASVGDAEGAHGALGGGRAKHVERLGRNEQDMLHRLGLREIPEDVPGFTADVLAQRLRNVAAGDAAPQPASGNRFVRSGDVWAISFEDTEIQMRDSKGLADLATLLSRPGVEVAALDLMGAGVVAGDSGPASDTRARKQYEARIRELQEDIDNAADSYQAEKAREELDTLVDHLTAAYGLGGKERSEGQPAEKARSAVTWRIRSSVKKITKAHPALGAHLDRSIRTGRFCVYDPDPKVSWDVLQG